MQLVVLFMGSPFKVYYLYYIISITVFFHIIICANIYNISFFLLPNKVAIERPGYRACRSRRSDWGKPGRQRPGGRRESPVCPGDTVSSLFMTQKTWMSGGLGHLCVHICWNEPREPPEDGVMNEVTLPSRHRIRNSSPGGLRPSTLSLAHRGSPQYYIFTSERGSNNLVLWNLNAPGPQPCSWPIDICFSMAIIVDTMTHL